MQTLADFSSKWSHPDYPPDQVDPDALDDVEAALGLTLPTAYRAAVTYLTFLNS